MSRAMNNPDTLTNTETTPVVSVIMNCYNSSRYLKEAIDSIYSQTFKDWEIVFWDNASTDNSPEIAKNYDSKLRYFRGENTVPLYAARNLALEYARGDYIAIIDCDDLWLPTKLEEQVSLIEKDNEVGMVFSDVILFNEKGMEKPFFKAVKPERGRVFQQLLFNNFINTQTVLIRNKFWGDTPLFDDRLNYSGDYDAYLRICYRWKVDYIDKPLARYRIHSSSITSKGSWQYLAEEIGLTIDSLKKAIPDFEEKYPEGLRFMERRQKIQASILDWEKGDTRSARKAVNAYVFENIYLFVLYVLMFFPYRLVFKLFHRFYKRNPVSDLI